MLWPQPGKNRIVSTQAGPPPRFPAPPEGGGERNDGWMQIGGMHAWYTHACQPPGRAPGCMGGSPGEQRRRPPKIDLPDRPRRTGSAPIKGVEKPCFGCPALWKNPSRGPLFSPGRRREHQWAWWPAWPRSAPGAPRYRPGRPEHAAGPHGPFGVCPYNHFPAQLFSPHLPAPRPWPSPGTLGSPPRSARSRHRAPLTPRCTSRHRACGPCGRTPTLNCSLFCLHLETPVLEPQHRKDTGCIHARMHEGSTGTGRTTTVTVPLEGRRRRSPCPGARSP